MLFPSQRGTRAWPRAFVVIPRTREQAHLNIESQAHTSSRSPGVSRGHPTRSPSAARSQLFAFARSAHTSLTQKHVGLTPASPQCARSASNRIQAMCRDAADVQCSSCVEHRNRRVCKRSCCVQLEANSMRIQMSRSTDRAVERSCIPMTNLMQLRAAGDGVEPILLSTLRFREFPNQQPRRGLV